MASAKQIEANRRNARRSTGPKTPEGKAASSKNALTHGLLSRDTVLPEENREDLERLLAAYIAEFQPATPAEEFLVHTMASSQWRLHRLSRVETGLFDKLIGDVNAEHVRKMKREGDPDPDGPDVPESRKYDRNTGLLGWAFHRDCSGPESFAILSRYEASLRRSYHKSLEELRRLRSRPLKNCETKPISEPGAASPPPAGGREPGTTASSLVEHELQSLLQVCPGFTLRGGLIAGAQEVGRIMEKSVGLELLQ